MKDLGITKGEWRHNKHSRGNVEANGRSVANCMGYSTNIGRGEHIEENYANADLVIDAGNTAQVCGLLPSELLKQRDTIYVLAMDFIIEVIKGTGADRAGGYAIKIEAAIKSTEQ